MSLSTKRMWCFTRALTACFAPIISSEKAHHEQLSRAEITMSDFEPAP